VLAVTVVPKTGRSPGSTKLPQGEMGPDGGNEGPGLLEVVPARVPLAAVVPLVTPKGPNAMLVPLADPPIAARGHGTALGLGPLEGP
jgi:hypothetical protein